MKKNCFFLLTLLFFSCIKVFPQVKKTIEYVNLFIGTAGDHGQMDPSACVPFGMVKIGPDTRPLNHAGYDYLADTIIGFSHNRLSGTGCKGAGGDVRILPGYGKVVCGYTYDKKSEAASPGYYTVKFNNGIHVELTATNQTGFHRYFFPKKDNAWLLIDLNSSFAGAISSSFQLDSVNQISGYVEGHNVCKIGRYRTFFVINSNVSLSSVKTYEDKLLVLVDKMRNPELNLKVTLSTISVEQAIKDRDFKTKGKDFNLVKGEAAEVWRSYLDRILVEGREEYKELFYTHLYNSLLNPVNSMSTDGKYKGTDGNIYQAKGYTHYDGWSIWDNFRNKFSLLALLYPDLSSDIARSLIDIYNTGKSTWSGYYEPVPTVRTEHSLLVLLDLYKRGINGIDFDSIYEKLVYEVANLTPYSPDMQLEIAYDYWGISQIAKIINKHKDAEFFLQKAMDYPNGKYGWNSNFKTIDKLSDVMHAKGLYEGTVWQYRWHVQFDIPGLIDLMGGKQQFTEGLNYFFDNNLFNFGNQPSIHVPYMFNYSETPWLTQKWVNALLTKETVNRYGTHNHFKTPYIGRIFKNKPDGFLLEMDNDDGTMSSWFVLSSMGLYSLTVGEPVFEITSSIFDKVVMNLKQGRIFEIHSKNFSDISFYITFCKLNGNVYNKTYISHQDLIQGGILEFDLSDKPNFKWGLNR